MLVFVAPVHGDHQIVALRTDGRQILLHLILVDEGDLIFLPRRQTVAVEAIGIGKEAEADALLFQNAQLGRFLLRAEGAEDALEGPGMDIFQTGLQPLDALVQGMVRGKIDHIEAHLDQRISHLRRGRQIGIGADLACEHDLLINEGDVAAGNDIGDVLIKWVEAIAAVGLLRIHGKGVVEQIVAHSGEPQGNRLRLGFRFGQRLRQNGLRRKLRLLHRGGLRVLRDPTRGGVATTLCEFVEGTALSILLEEADIPVRPAVASACDILGLDPLYCANEGKLLAVVAPERAEEALALLRGLPEGENAAVIGTVGEQWPGRVAVRTALGGTRIAAKLAGAQLPRIC